MHPVLSFIIPIYKTEQYLSQCLDSILSQITDDMEVILVDDGSPDSCPTICDDYASRHPEIHVLHKQNEGLSCARNSGLELARGEYVWFIDSDDYLLPEALDNIIKAIKNNNDVEVFSSGLLKYYEDKDTFEPENVPYGKSFLKRGEYIWNNCPPGAAQRFVCQRDFLLRHGLTFVPNLLHEDSQWGFRMLYLANGIRILEAPVYVYRIRTSGSIMSSISIKSAYDLVKAHKSLISFMKEHVLENDRKKYVWSIWITLNIIKAYCYPLLKTKDFECFLAAEYPYIKQQARKLVKYYPFRLKSYFFQLHPYSQIKLLRLLGRQFK